MEDFFCEDINLNVCRINKQYKIVVIEQGLDIKHRQRMLELGFVKGVKIKVVKKSLLKKTLLVEIHSYTLSIRSEIAEFVKVE